MKVIIKNMVSIRCKMLVRSELENLEIDYKVIELGEVSLFHKIADDKRDAFKVALRKWGLELMDDKRSILIEKIKSVIVEMIHYAEELPKMNYSAYISEKLQQDYTYLANLFSEVVGITIEHFIIAHKIEKVKELMVYDEMNLTEIAEKLHYSSVAHLSNQFKKVTGLTPSHFKHLKKKRRFALDNM
ncbi:MAG: AraC family transcriptional regulator [Ginsengibacter sp.]